MEKAENNDWLGLNQTGGRKDMNAVKSAPLNEPIINIHRL